MADDSNKIAVTTEGVKTIQNLSKQIDEGGKKIKTDAQSLGSIDTAGLGGEHVKEIQDAIKAVEQAISESTEPIKTVVERLNNLANTYNAIINKDFGYKSIKSNINQGK